MICHNFLKSKENVRLKKQEEQQRTLKATCKWRGGVQKHSSGVQLRLDVLSRARRRISIGQFMKLKVTHKQGRVHILRPKWFKSLKRNQESREEHATFFSCRNQKASNWIKFHMSSDVWTSMNTAEYLGLFFWLTFRVKRFALLIRQFKCHITRREYHLLQPIQILTELWRSCTKATFTFSANFGSSCDVCSTCKISCLECWNIEWAQCSKIKGISHEMHFRFCLTRAHTHADVEHDEHTHSTCVIQYLWSQERRVSPRDSVVLKIEVE